MSRKLVLRPTPGKGPAVRIRTLMPSTIPSDVQALARVAQRARRRSEEVSDGNVFDLSMRIEKELQKRGWIIEARGDLSSTHIRWVPGAAQWPTMHSIRDLSAHELAAIYAADRKGMIP
jgi:hypothetical protein